MDTPGLDSLNDAQKIVLQIQDKILTNRLQIIGIGYLISLEGSFRFVDENQDSPML